MKTLGVLKELTPDIDGAVALRECSGQLDPALKESVLRYLANGIGVLDSMESTPDPRQPDRSIPGGSSLLSDGVWCWRLDLSAYIEVYDIGLPEAFLEMVTSQRTIPPASDLEVEVIEQAVAAWGWA